MKNTNNKNLYISHLKKVSILLPLFTLGMGCAPKKEETATKVTSSFKMTGSSAAATVAKNSTKGFWDLLLNKAYALLPSTLQDSTGLTITLSQAWTVVKEIEFKSEETAGAEDNSSEVEFQGPYFVDLLSTSPLILDTKQISEKPIKRIKMKLHKAETLPSTAPVGLTNNSIYVVGSVGGHNFTFQLDDASEIQIAGPNSFQPSENSELLVEVQLANIFKQINMSGVVNNEVISASNRHNGSNLCNSIDTSASDIYTCIRKGLEKYANFGQDNDGDDDLDSNDSKVE